MERCHSERSHPPGLLEEAEVAAQDHLEVCSQVRQQVHIMHDAFQLVSLVSNT